MKARQAYVQARDLDANARSDRLKAAVVRSKSVGIGDGIAAIGDHA